jgi:hypothetical protein
MVNRQNSRTRFAVRTALHACRSNMWFIAPDHVFNDLVVDHQHRFRTNNNFSTRHIDVNNKSLRATAACDATSLTKRDQFD